MLWMYIPNMTYQIPPPAKILPKGFLALLVLSVTAFASDGSGVFGFESTQDWVLQQGQGVVAVETNPQKIREGNAALSIQATNWNLLQSRAFSTTLLRVEDSLAFHIYIPEMQSNPWWTGSVDVAVHMPSAGVYRQYVGHAELTPLPKGQWSKLAFAWPSAIKAGFQGVHDDAQIEIAVNSSNGSGPFLLDQMEGLSLPYTQRFDEGDNGAGTFYFYGMKNMAVAVEYTVENTPQGTGVLARVGSPYPYTLPVTGLPSQGTLRWRYTYLQDGFAANTPWYSYTLLGTHRTLGYYGKTWTVKPYDPSKPIVLGPTDSRRYAFAVCTRALKSTERASLEAAGTTVVGVSHSATYGNYRVAYSGDINALAANLKASIPCFLGFAPLPLAKPVSRAHFPTTNPGEPLRLMVGCHSDVTLAECRGIVLPYAVGGNVINHSSTALSFLTWESSLLALASHEQVSMVAERERQFPSMVNALIDSRVSELQTPFQNEFLPSVLRTDMWLANQPYTGLGIKVGVYDTGLDPTHPAFQEQPIGLRNAGGAWLPPQLDKDGALDPHGTHVAGIIAGNGLGQPTESDATKVHHGVAPKVLLYAKPIVFDGAQEQGDVTNHSHQNEFIHYDEDAQKMDEVIHNQSFIGQSNTVVVAAAGNAGVGKQYGNAFSYYSIGNSFKNPIVVGSSYIGQKVGYSSLGPTPDGRIKPDVMAPGKEILSVGDATNEEGIKSTGLNGSYIYRTGTSQSAPHVTGIVALMQQKFKLSTAYNGQTPWNSTIKGILIHTSRDMISPIVCDGNGGRNSDLEYNPDNRIYKRDNECVQLATPFFEGPDYATGWGRVDAVEALKYTEQNTHYREMSISNDDVIEFPFVVPNPVPSNALKFTITWDDPAWDCDADPLSLCQINNIALVNDLDMHLEYYGNEALPSTATPVKFFPWKLKPFFGNWSIKQDIFDSIWFRTEDGNTTGPSSPGFQPITVEEASASKAFQECQPNSQDTQDPEGCYDHLNNVEQVLVKNPLPGQWKAVIKANRMGTITQSMSSMSAQSQRVSIIFDYPEGILTSSSSTDYSSSSIEISSSSQSGSSSSDIPSSSSTPVMALRKLFVTHGAKGKACPIDRPYKRMDDMNQGVGGEYIYLCALYSDNELDGAPIREIKPIIASSPWIDLVSAIMGWERIPSDAFPNAASSYDINKGAGGKYIYLYASRLPASGAPITDLTLVTSKTGYLSPPSGGWVPVPADLNDGAGGTFQYLWFTKGIQKPVLDITLVASPSHAYQECPENYELSSIDLNRGSGGQYIFACVRYGDTSPYVMDLKTKSSGSPITSVPSDPEFAGYETVGLNTAPSVPYDLNAGSGGKYIYLFQKKGFVIPITGISFIASSNLITSSPSSGWEMLPQDLNKGADGAYIYLIYRRGL